MIALVLALLLASPASAALCTDSYSGTVSVTSSEVQVWSQNIAGGAVPAGNAMRVTVGLTLDSQTWQSVNANVYLNGEPLGSACAVGNVESGSAEFFLTRTANTMGDLQTRMWTGDGSNETEWTGQVTDLAWTSQQTLAVKIDGQTTGSAYLRVCVER
jgi:hypothetical protein